MNTYIQKYKLHLMGVLVLLLLIWAGFSQRMYTVISCSSTVSRYVTAEYSETYVSVDMEGMPTTEYNYYSSPASEVYTITKINEMPEYPPMPDHDTSMGTDFDFDNFQFHTDTNLAVLAKDAGGSTAFSTSISKAKSCIESINHAVIVDTWYTITYSSDF